ncbi:DsrE family protein [Haladaptatus sp. DJG-WS-42]|uniref:DsrE family protein n=1 Tax=Haladaptatus sp. DJG-WS-42 TaxID=3120516 RepID=UPI0030CF32AB
MERRHFVTAAGVLFLAGCTSGGASSTDEPTDSQTTDATATTDQQTDEPTETTTTEEPLDMSTVFHLQSDGAENERKALNNVANLQGDETVDVDDIVLVANSKAVNALTTEGSDYPDRIKQLQNEQQVTFCACQNSMDAIGIAEQDLLEGVKIVPSGVGEFTRLQAMGYAYIKVA